jgi:hypothetical protein
MALDLNAFPPDVKLALITSGERFSSDDTFAQSTQTMQALVKYDHTVKPYGLPLSDAIRLGEARGYLSAAGYGRNQAKSQKKSLGADFEDAQKAARKVRLRARSVLTSTKTGLLEQSETEAANEVQAALDATSNSESAGDDLAKQLDQLAAALDPNKAAKAAAVAADRGGPESATKLAAAATALRDTQKQKPAARGTPEETQRIDLIDGIIIDICRRAREAAKAAAKDLGDPAILKAFKLDKLYASSKAAASKKAKGAGGSGGGGAVPAAGPAGGTPDPT